MSGEATSPLMPIDLEEEEDVETRGKGRLMKLEIIRALQEIMQTNTKFIQSCQEAMAVPSPLRGSTRAQSM